MTSNVTYRVFTEHLGGTDVNEFVGSEGDIFFDPEIGTLRVYSGEPGGSIVSANGVVYTLPTASPTVLGGVKIDGTSVTISTSGVISSPFVNGQSIGVNNLSVSGSITGPVSASANVNVSGTVNAARVNATAAAITSATVGSAVINQANVNNLAISGAVQTTINALSDVTVSGRLSAINSNLVSATISQANINNLALTGVVQTNLTAAANVNVAGLLTAPSASITTAVMDTANASVMTVGTLNAYNATINTAVAYGLTSIAVNTYDISVTHNAVLPNTSAFGYLSVYGESLFHNNVTVERSLTVNNALYAGNSAGNVGQVLTSNGSGIYWGPPNSNGSFPNGQSIIVNALTVNSIFANASFGTIGQYLTSDGANVYWSTRTATFANGQSITVDGLTVNSITANGSVGTAGQVLTSNGINTYWALPTPSFVNGQSISVNVATVNAVSANGGVGTAGQYLTSNGSTSYWSSPVPSFTNGQSIVVNEIEIGSGDLSIRSFGNGTYFLPLTNNADITILAQSPTPASSVNASLTLTGYQNANLVARFGDVNITAGDGVSISGNNITINASNVATIKASNTAIDGQLSVNASAYVNGFVTSLGHKSGFTYLNYQTVPSAVDTYISMGSGAAGNTTPFPSAGANWQSDFILTSDGKLRNGTSRTIIALVSYQVAWASSLTGARTAWLEFGIGSRFALTNIATSPDFTVQGATGFFIFNPGDALSLKVWQNSGGVLGVGGQSSGAPNNQSSSISLLQMN